METAMLQIQELSFAYKKKHTVFRDFSLNIG